ncbi:MAG: hypothetical protein WA364_27540, partial [Candidatus Nitrosopolaris sp.]
DKLISYSITWVPVIMAEMTIMTMTILRIGLTLVVESLELVTDNPRSSPALLPLPHHTFNSPSSIAQLTRPPLIP